ncbi:hypothetical protein D3C78_1489020 [compost metagenome]
MAATYAAATGLYRAAQEAHGARMVITALFQFFDAFLRIVGKQFGNDIAFLIGDPLRRAEADHLLGFQLDGQLGRHFL